MIKDVGLGVEHGVEIVSAAFPIGGEHLDGAVRITMTNCANGGGPDRGTAILEFIAGDRGDHTMA